MISSAKSDASARLGVHLEVVLVGNTISAVLVLALIVEEAVKTPWYKNIAQFCSYLYDDDLLRLSKVAESDET